TERPAVRTCPRARVARKPSMVASSMETSSGPSVAPVAAEAVRVTPARMEKQGPTSQREAKAELAAPAGRRARCRRAKMAAMPSTALQDRTDWAAPSWAGSEVIAMSRRMDSTDGMANLAVVAAAVVEGAD